MKEGLKHTASKTTSPTKKVHAMDTSSQSIGEVVLGDKKNIYTMASTSNTNADTQQDVGEDVEKKSTSPEECVR